MDSTGVPRSPAELSDGLRVVLFSNNYRPRVSGVAVAVEFLERALRRAGHRTLVVAPDYDPARPDGRSGVLRARSLPLKPWQAALPLPRRRELAAEIERFRPHLLHSHHPFLLGRTAIRIARQLHSPLVYTFHTFYEAFLQPAGLALRPLIRFVRRRVRRYLERCDLVVAPTEPVRVWLERGLPSSVRTATAPTGLDPARFASIPAEDRASFRARLGVAPDEPLLVWAGRVTAEKSPLLAVETLAALRERGHDAALAVIGRGPAQQAIDARARALGVEGKVRVAGFVERDELPAALAAGDLFLFTSWSDTQAIVAYEAWAAGLPLVSVRSLAGRALVEDGVNGILAQSDARSFADAAEALLRFHDLCRAPFPWDRYGPEALAARWRGIYGEAIEGHGSEARARAAVSGGRTGEAIGRAPRPVIRPRPADAAEHPL